MGCAWYYFQSNSNLTYLIKFFRIINLPQIIHMFIYFNGVHEIALLSSQIINNTNCKQNSTDY
jgi:hypothetical protein